MSGGKIDRELRTIFPNLWGISLDPMHLPFKVDGSFRKRRQKPTIVGLVLRAVMRKFAATPLPGSIWP